MSAFKDMVAADMDAVFLNLDEFADEHDLNGTVCACIVESPSKRERFQQGKDYEGYEVVHGATVTVHAKKSDVGEVPAEGERFDLDGEIHYVAFCVEHMGMLSIELRANIAG
jgi:hypothetical protein